LALALAELLESPEKRERMGKAARDLVARNVGASQRYAGVILSELASS
jgi:hypothetical protein